MSARSTAQCVGAEHERCSEGRAGAAGRRRSGGDASVEEKGRPTGEGGRLDGEEQGGSPTGVIFYREFVQGETDGGGRPWKK
jgi:hypothetical protein